MHTYKLKASVFLGGQNFVHRLLCTLIRGRFPTLNWWVKGRVPWQSSPLDRFRTCVKSLDWSNVWGITKITADCFFRRQVAINWLHITYKIWRNPVYFLPLRVNWTVQSRKELCLTLQSFLSMFRRTQNHRVSSMSSSTQIGSGAVSYNKCKILSVLRYIDNADDLLESGELPNGNSKCSD